MSPVPDRKQVNIEIIWAGHIWKREKGQFPQMLWALLSLLWSVTLWHAHQAVVYAFFLSGLSLLCSRSAIFSLWSQLSSKLINSIRLNTFCEHVASGRMLVGILVGWRDSMIRPGGSSHRSCLLHSLHLLVGGRFLASTSTHNPRTDPSNRVSLSWGWASRLWSPFSLRAQTKGCLCVEAILS